MCLTLFEVLSRYYLSLNTSSNFMRWVLLLSLIYKWGNWDRGGLNNLLIPTNNLVLIIVAGMVSSAKNFETWCQDIDSGSMSLEHTLLPSPSLPACPTGEQCSNVCPSAFRVACFQMIFLPCKKILFTHYENLLRQELTFYLLFISIVYFIWP